MTRMAYERAYRRAQVTLAQQQATAQAVKDAGMTSGSKRSTKTNQKPTLGVDAQPGSYAETRRA